MKLAHPFLFLVIWAFLFTSQIKAQDLDFTDALSAGGEDSELYLKNYINPFMTGFAYGLSNGWYNTAKPHKFLGFDVTATANVAFVPDKDLFFDFEGFENLSVAEGSERIPTVFGPEASTNFNFSNTNQVTYVDPDPANPTFGQEVTTEETLTGDFDAPDGLNLEDEIGFSFVPVPMVQLGIGLVENTEVKFRYLPPISTDDFEFRFYGVGIMHDFKQWTPGISHLPFDMSGFVGYTRLTAESEFSEDNGDEGLAGSDQVAKYDVSALTMQVVASKKLSILTVYGGFGYTVANSDLSMTGTYVIEGESEITLQDGSTEIVDSFLEETDPIDISFRNTSPRATLGFRLQLLVVTIHADYTIQEYNALTVGLGVSVR